MFSRMSFGNCVYPSNNHQNKIQNISTSPEGSLMREYALQQTSLKSPLSSLLLSMSIVQFAPAAKNVIFSISNFPKFLFLMPSLFGFSLFPLLVYLRSLLYRTACLSSLVFSLLHSLREFSPIKQSLAVTQKTRILLLRSGRWSVCVCVHVCACMCEDCDLVTKGEGQPLFYINGSALFLFSWNTMFIRSIVQQSRPDENIS